MSRSLRRKSICYFLLLVVPMVTLSLSSPTSALLRPTSIVLRENLQSTTTTTTVCPPLIPVTIAPTGTNNLLIPNYLPPGNQVAVGNNPILMTVNPCSAPVPSTGFLHVQLYFTSSGQGVQNGYIPSVSGGVVGFPVSVFTKGGCAFTSASGTYGGKQIPAGSLIFFQSPGACILTAVQYMNPLASVPFVSIPVSQEVTPG